MSIGSPGLAAATPLSSNMRDYLASPAVSQKSISSGLATLVGLNKNRDSCDYYHNITLYPQFVDLAAADYHLQASSPCINAGDSELPLDPDSSLADIGAFHYETSENAHGPSRPLPSGFDLEVFPNPFNEVVKLAFRTFATTNRVDLTVFNSIGQRVALLWSGAMAPGTHYMEWNAASYGAGIYFLRLESTDRAVGNDRQTRKLIFLK